MKKQEKSVASDKIYRLKNEKAPLSFMLASRNTKDSHCFGTMKNQM